MLITHSKIPSGLSKVTSCQRLKVFHRKYRTKGSTAVVSLLTKLCGEDDGITKHKLNQHPAAKLKPDPVLMRSCANILQKAGYSAEYIRDHVDILSYPPGYLRNCLYICQEYACYNDQIGPVINDFCRFMNLRINHLKKVNVIPSRINVLDSLLYYMKIPKNECDVEINDQLPVKEVYWKFFNYYLKREMHIDDEAVRKLRRFDYFISFRLLRENLYLLRKSFGFTGAELLEMPFLIRTDPENTISILRSARGVNLKEAIVAHPRLLTVPSQHIQVVNDYLIKNDMDFNDLLNDPDVLGMDINTLMYRLAKIVHSPSLNVFKQHPRVGRLVQNSGVASERMLILKQLDMDCYDLALLTCHTSSFLRHIIDGIDRSNGKDVSLIVSRRLSVPLEDVERELSKNEGLAYVPLQTVKTNLDYLIEMGFSNEDIFRSVQILLYPKHLVENQLSDILINSVVVNDSIEYQVLNKKYFLPLALYYIEKEARFTESGIWKEKYNENTVSMLTGKFSDFS